MPDREPLDEDKLKGLLAAEIRAADTFYRSELSSTRARNMEYYRGQMDDTPAMVGRSSIVSRDVADTIGWMLPGIIRVFTASDRMGEFEPFGPGDEEGAEQATDYVNHVFWKDNPGYRILWDGTHDSLLQENGIIKHYWDDSEECDYAEMTGMTEEQIALLMQDGTEIVAQKPGEPQKVPQAGPDGQMTEVEIPTFDIKTKRVTSTGRVCIECIEPENFLKDKDSVLIEDARFCAHRDPYVTRSDLIEMGFNKDIVDELPAWKDHLFSEESAARTEDFDWSGVGDHSTQTIELYECYIKADADGDGISETIRAYYAGAAGAGELLDWEVWDDDVPFSDIPCEPVPHRWNARSIADETTDIQRIKTVLQRQLLDNLYATSIPMQEAEQGSIINPEMLASPKFGGIIWRKKGSQPVIPHEVPFVADKVLTALEYMDTVVEKRTGVSRATMALDPQTLQNQTATANQNQRDAAYSQIELIARNQAELGWRRVFKMVLRLVIKHQDRPRVIRLRDKWVEIDPRYWNANMDVTINVGLGTGSRDRDMAMLTQIQGTQIAVAQIFREAGAIDQAIQMIPKIVKTATEAAESSGIRNPDAYYPELDDQAVQGMIQNAAEMAEKPDPKVEAQKQIEAAKIQAQSQSDQQKLQASAIAEQQKSQAQVTREAAQLQADLQTKEADRQNQLMIEAQKQQFEREKLAEESRQKDLDRALQWQIEQLKASAQREVQERQMAVESANKQADREHSAGIETMKAKAKPKKQET